MTHIALKACLGLVIACVSLPFDTIACTIFSGVGKDGHVWTGNNEDGMFSRAHYLNAFPKTAGSRFGYFTLSAETPRNGENGNIQGGMNEAGLTYDFNALDREYPVKDRDKKKTFPKGDDAILRHILENFETVEEVAGFFEKYWFKGGFTRAQMHVADKHGHFAMISPSGSSILTNAAYQVSTNFRIVGKENEEGSTCWRFPIATKKLEQNGASLESFTDISKSTAQKGRGTTIYSNVQNLTTGELWFYFAQDYATPFKSNIKDMLGKGRKSYLIPDLCQQGGIRQAE